MKIFIEEFWVKVSSVSYEYITYRRDFFVTKKYIFSNILHWKYDTII